MPCGNDATSGVCFQERRGQNLSFYSSFDDCFPPKATHVRTCVSDMGEPYHTLSQRVRSSVFARREIIDHVLLLRLLCIMSRERIFGRSASSLCIDGCRCRVSLKKIMRAKRARKSTGNGGFACSLQSCAKALTDVCLSARVRSAPTRVLSCKQESPIGTGFLRCCERFRRAGADKDSDRERGRFLRPFASRRISLDDSSEAQACLIEWRR